MAKEHTIPHESSRERLNKVFAKSAVDSMRGIRFDEDLEYRTFVEIWNELGQGKFQAFALSLSPEENHELAAHLAAADNDGEEDGDL